MNLVVLTCASDVSKTVSWNALYNRQTKVGDPHIGFYISTADSDVFEAVTLYTYQSYFLTSLFGVHKGGPITGTVPADVDHKEKVVVTDKLLLKHRRTLE